jgi:hypothetical protein
MKKILFFLLLFKNSYSQHLEWAKTIKASEYSESNVVAHRIDKDKNHYIMTAINGKVNFDLNNINPFWVNSIEKNNYTIVLAKYDSLQNLLWSRSFKTNLQISIPLLYWGFDIDNSNNLYLFGTYKDSIITKNNDSSIIKIESKGNQDFFVMKMDEYGNANWIKNFGNKSSDVCRQIKTYENDIYIGGYLGDSFNIKIKDSIFYYSPAIKNQQDLFIAKLNTKGDLYWFNHIKQSSNIIFFNDIYINKNGIRALIGGSNSKIEVNTDDSSYSEIIGYMEEGNVLIDMTLDGKFKKINVFRSPFKSNEKFLNRIFHKIVVDSSENIYLGGLFLRKGTIKIGSSTNFNSNPGVILLKMDTFGNMLWNKNYIGAPLLYYSLESLSLNIHNEKLYLSGDFKDSISFPTLNYSFVLKSKNYNNTFLSIHDLEGNFLSAFSPKSNNFTRNVGLNVKTKDNKIYWVGDYIDSTDFDATLVSTYLESNKSRSTFLCKYNLTLLPLDSIEKEEDNSSINEQNKSKIKLFPNPTIDFLNIELSAIPNFLSIKVLDVIGNEIITQEFQKQKVIKVDLSTIPKGIYLFKVVIDHSQNQYFKIIKE